MLAGFVLVLFYDVGAISLALAVAPSGRGLLATVMGNPVEAVRILAIMSIEPDMRLLGPLGSYMSEEIGGRGSVLLLGGALLFWTAAPLGLAAEMFARKDV